MPEITISKELFVESMEAIKAQHFHDLTCMASLSVVFPQSHSLWYNNSFLEGAIIELLKAGMCDEGDHSWIEYFIFELDFGRKYREGCVTENDGIPIDISTPELLWGFLANLHVVPCGV